MADRRAGIDRNIYIYAGCKRSVGRAAQRRYGLDRHGCGVTACKRTARAGGNGVAVAARRADIARRDGRAADLVAQRCRAIPDHAVDVHRQRFAEADTALVRRRDVAQQLVIDGHRPSGERGVHRDGLAAVRLNHAEIQGLSLLKLVADVVDEQAAAHVNPFDLLIAVAAAGMAVNRVERNIQHRRAAAHRPFGHTAGRAGAEAEPQTLQCRVRIADVAANGKLVDLNARRAERRIRWIGEYQLARVIRAVRGQIVIERRPARRRCAGGRG